MRDRRAHRIRRRTHRPLLGELVAHAAPAGHGVQRATRRQDPRCDGVHALVRCPRVHDRLLLPARPSVPAARARRRPRGPRGAAGDRRARRSGDVVNFAEYVITGWVLTGVVLAGYWLWIVQRTKRAEPARGPRR